VQEADERLRLIEGHGLERLVGRLYEERSRKGLGDFPLTHRVQGDWDRGRTEIDLVVLNEEDKCIRFGTCKRNAAKLTADLAGFAGNVARFLSAHPQYRAWRVEKVAIAPRIDPALRRHLEERDVIAQDLVELSRGL